MELLANISEQLRDLGLQVGKGPALPVAGGDICQSIRLDGSPQIFLKVLQTADTKYFQTEFLGLDLITDAVAGLAPRPYAWGYSGSPPQGLAWLAMPYLEMQHRSERCDVQLGEQLARLHSCTGNQHGFDHDGYIGRTRQPNTFGDNWHTFFVQYRLRPQLASLGLESRLNSLDHAFLQSLAGRQPQPSLLHGDLWSGNAASTDGNPIIYDPAPYWGDHETDLAMMEMFGGFSQGCFTAYGKTLAIDTGYEQRRPFYQLYHVLNHANMFGGGYITRSRQMIEELTYGV